MDAAVPSSSTSSVRPIMKERDTRIDVLRALALISIFVNHVPGNPLEALTHKNFGFSDAAEAFVLISGISAAIAYGGKFDAGHGFAATLMAWRRAGVLYISHLALTLFTLASYTFLSIFFMRPDLLEHNAIPRVLEMPAASMLGIVTLGHQLGYNNILSTYVLLMLALPAMLLLARVSLPMMVSLSFAVWLGAGLNDINIPNWPGTGDWFLNPFAWQFLFFIGVAASLHVRRGGTIPRPPWLIGLAAGYLLVSLAWVRIPLWGIDTSLGLPTVLTGFSKGNLSAFRMLHVLSAAYLIVALPVLSSLLRTSQTNPLAVMGRHGLPVFIAGTMMAMVLQPLRIAMPLPVVVDALIVLAGCGVLFALVYWLEFVGRVKRQIAAGRKPVPSTPPEQAGSMVKPAR